MIEAYVMIQTASGMAREILPAVKAIEGVKRANIVAGETDIIADIEAESSHELLMLVTDQIQTLEGVGRTRTCVILE